MSGTTPSGWRSRARGQQVREPVSVYEVHLGSWRPGLSYVQLADELTEYVSGLGFTHVEFLPVAEHPFGGSWGYQVTSYFAPTARFGTPDEFRYLVDRLHQAGIGVILDWVPAHFPRDEWALARFDGTPLYEHPDPRRGEHPDWGTLIFNYGRNEVRNFLVANALYWLEEFHADGLRVDAVASMLYLDYSRKAGEWVPNAQGGRENTDAVALLQEVNSTSYRRVPGVMMIAEESTAWPGVTRPVHLGGLGFGFKWNLGWMHDTLSYMSLDPVYRQYHHNEITFSLMYAFSENFVLPLSHDEVVHGKGSLLGKMPGDEWNRFAGLRAMLAYMWAHPGKQLLFMGSEFGQGNEWSAERGLDWWMLDYPGHAGVRKLVGDMNRAYRGSPAMWALDNSPSGFSWIDANDAAGNVLSFLRLAGPGGRPGRPGGDRLRGELLRRPALTSGYRRTLAGTGQHRRRGLRGSGVELGVIEARCRARQPRRVLTLRSASWLVPDGQNSRQRNRPRPFRRDRRLDHPAGPPAPGSSRAAGPPPPHSLTRAGTASPAAGPPPRTTPRDGFRRRTTPLHSPARGSTPRSVATLPLVPRVTLAPPSTFHAAVRRPDSTPEKRTVRVNVDAGPGATDRGRFSLRRFSRTRSGRDGRPARCRPGRSPRAAPGPAGSGPGSGRSGRR